MVILITKKLTYGQWTVTLSILYKHVYSYLFSEETQKKDAALDQLAARLAEPTIEARDKQDGESGV